MRGRTSSADAALHTAGVVAYRRPKGRHLPEQVKAKNPRGFGRQSHPIPSMTQ
jgi:hypothetical protein